MSNDFFLDVFGQENLARFEKQQIVLNEKEEKLEELALLNEEFIQKYNVNLSLPDVLVAASAGVLLGLANVLFKGYIPKKGKFRHNHNTTRTAIDYQSPKPPGYKGSVQDLHRQLGPTHDIMRMNEAVQIVSGEKTDFKLWSSSATKILGHELKPGNLSLEGFRKLGGFRIPTDPKAELLHHQMIDFFTKRSLPIPGTTYIADHSPEFAKVMFGMYDKGFNLKNALGNFFGFLLVELVMRSYILLFKAIPRSSFSLTNLSVASVKKLCESYKYLTKQNEFHLLMMLAHGASVLVDSLISYGTGNIALFQLNFLSILAFAKHLYSFTIKNAKQGKELLQEIRVKDEEIVVLDAQWYSGFKENMAVIASDEQFIEIFDLNEWEQNTKRITNFVTSIEDTQRRRRELIRQLEE